MKNNLLTIIVPTRNEALNIRQCLEGLKSLKIPIVVFDSFSEDETLKIVSDFDIPIIQGEWRSFSEKINAASSHPIITSDWVMRVDADESLDALLKSNLRNNIENSPVSVSAFTIDRRFVFMGKWLKYGGMSPSWQIRIWKKGCAVMEERELDEHMIVDGEIYRMPGAIYDDDQKGLSVWIQKHNHYSDNEVEQIHQNSENTELPQENTAMIKRFLKEKVYYRAPLFARPFLLWFVKYVFLLGFLDGRSGFIFHILHSFWYRFLIDAKLYERRKNRVSAK